MRLLIRGGIHEVFIFVAITGNRYSPSLALPLADIDMNGNRYPGTGATRIQAVMECKSHQEMHRYNSGPGLHWLVH